MRTVAAYDPVRALEVMRWPLREVLLGYVERLRERSRFQHAVEMLAWSAIAPHTGKRSRPPAVPEILKVGDE